MSASRRRACCSCAPSSTPATTASRSTADRASTTDPVPSSRTRSRPWNDRSSQPSPTRPRRRASRSPGCPDRPGIAGRVLTALAEANVNVDMIIQNEPQSARATWPTCRSPSRATTWPTAREALEPLKQELGFGEVQTDDRMGKVSVVGAGMKSHPGRRGQDVHRARRGRREHRDDLHLADQDLVRRARGARGRRPCASCTRRSSSAPTRSCPRTWPAITARRWPSR